MTKFDEFLGKHISKIFDPDNKELRKKYEKNFKEFNSFMKNIEREYAKNFKKYRDVFTDEKMSNPMKDADVFRFAYYELNFPKGSDLKSEWEILQDFVRDNASAKLEYQDDHTICSNVVNGKEDLDVLIFLRKKNLEICLNGSLKVD